MNINEIYKKYFQKSKIFMYPLLGIERGNVIPEEVYFSINDIYLPQNKKLVLVYDPEMDFRYKSFKDEILINHNLLHDQLVDQFGNEVFVFDMSSFGSDWELFIAGKYSQISLEIKKVILNYFEKNSANYVYIQSYLFPEKWFKRYAEILNVTEKMIMEVGELCDVPNLEREKFDLIITSQSDDFIEKNTTLLNLQLNKCERCNGHGYISKYNHISNGICFKCYGQKNTKKIAA